VHYVEDDAINTQTLLSNSSVVRQIRVHATMSCVVG